MTSWHLINDCGMSCRIIHGDARMLLHHYQDQIDLIITSPPYADARKAHYDSVLPDQYPQWFAQFHEVFWQALKPYGSLVINIKGKIVKGVRHHYEWHTIQQLSTLGWQCIDDYLWHKKTSTPGYWPTRLRDAWEYVFHLAKNKKPYLDQEAVKIPASLATIERIKRLKHSTVFPTRSMSGSGISRNLAAWKNKASVLPSNVLHYATETKNQAHPAVFPLALPSFFIKLLSQPHNLILDPFAGSGTTGVAAVQLGRHCMLIDNKFAYCELAKQRLMKECQMRIIKQSD